MVNIILIMALFFTAALFEIGGGYMIWLWLHERKGLYLGLFGGITLFLYGIIQTFQPAHFGRVYAAYGGAFIISSIIWGAIIDKKTLDKYEIIGSLIALVGVFIIFFVPR